jgi:succinate dehydrogenase/fumarate reductase cytochrome b subunit
MGTEMIKFPVAEPFHLSWKVSCGDACIFLNLLYHLINAIFSVVHDTT